MALGGVPPRVTYAYDDQGRLIEERRFAQDMEADWEDGKPVPLVEASCVEYAYDESGKRIDKSLQGEGEEPQGDGSSLAADYGEVKREYDKQGRPVRVHYECGEVMDVKYDARGRHAELMYRDAKGKPASKSFFFDDGTCLYGTKVVSRWGERGMLAERICYDEKGEVREHYQAEVKLDPMGNAIQWLGACPGSPDFMPAVAKRVIEYY